jgi:hypothetical protein
MCRHRMVLEFTITCGCAISAYQPKVRVRNPVHGELYSIQHYAIKFVSNLRTDDYINIGLTPYNSILTRIY